MSNLMGNRCRKLTLCCKFFCSCALVLSIMGFTASLPALAQSDPSVPPASVTASVTAPMPDNEQVWREHYAERRDIREERHELRHEHDALEAEHDSLRLQCLDAKGQDHSQCQEKWRSWHQREDALMVRVHALHDRAAADARYAHIDCPSHTGTQGVDPTTGHCLSTTAPSSP